MDHYDPSASTLSCPTPARDAGQAVSEQRNACVRQDQAPEVAVSDAGPAPRGSVTSQLKELDKQAPGPTQQ